MDKLKKFRAKAIIFDKDGTLIDFNAMWGNWVLVLAERLTAWSGVQTRDALCQEMGYDQEEGRVLPHGKLAATPMGQLYNFTVEVVRAQGLCKSSAEEIVRKAWTVPEPVKRARPFTNTRALFRRLHSEGIKLAIATTDDRDPTQALMDAFEINDYITTMVCGDDSIKAKPAPDMVFTICQRLGIDPSNTMLVGDTAADLTMARAAGVGLVVGVLSGVSSAKDLVNLADVLIDSVDDLQSYSVVPASRAGAGTDSQPPNGLHADLVS